MARDPSVQDADGGIARHAVDTHRSGKVWYRCRSALRYARQFRRRGLRRPVTQAQDAQVPTIERGDRPGAISIGQNDVRCVGNTYGNIGICRTSVEAADNRSRDIGSSSQAPEANSSSTMRSMREPWRVSTR